MPLEVTLTEKADNELTEHVFTVVSDAIEKARRDSGLDKPFLKKGAMAKWVGIDSKTLTKMIADGLPCHLVAGVQLFSKKEVEEFILDHKI